MSNTDRLFLGEGYSGSTVFRERLGDDFMAVKTIQTNLDMCELKEVEALVFLCDVPGVVKFLHCVEILEEDGGRKINICMEYVNGKTIDDYHKLIFNRLRDGHLSSSQLERIIISLLAQATKTVLEIHKMGWIHNDIKNENLLVEEGSHYDGGVRLVFIDLELAIPCDRPRNRFMELWSAFVAITGLISPEPSNPRWFVDRICKGDIPVTIPLCGVRKLREISCHDYLNQLQQHLTSTTLMEIIRSVLLADSNCLPSVDEVHNKLVQLTADDAIPSL